MYIDGLVNKNKYRFRVLAINKIGKSMPCEMNGDDILIKDPWGKFRISWLNCLKTTQRFKYDGYF